MLYRLSTRKADLSKDLRDKIAALKAQKSDLVYNGKPIRDKEEEWEIKFASYAGNRTKLEGIETQFTNGAVPADKYAETVYQTRTLEETISNQEKDLLGMLCEPVDKTVVEKAEQKAATLSRQRLDIRPLKGSYAAVKVRKQKP